MLDTFCTSGSSPTEDGSDSFLYDPEVFRLAINKALKPARQILNRIGGHNDFEDLRQQVDIEIWKASKQYGLRMNERLAFRIARNQGAAFLRKRTLLETVPVVDADGNPILDEFGSARGLLGSELKRQSEDPNARPEERRQARKLISTYVQRYPRFAHLDEKPQNVDGDESEMSSAEKEILRRRPSDRADLLRSLHDSGGIPALRQLVSTWEGDHRRVGEAMLEPNFTVRSVPGLNKTRVWRLRQAVVGAIKNFLS